MLDGVTVSVVLLVELGRVERQDGVTAFGHLDEVALAAAMIPEEIILEVAAAGLAPITRLLDDLWLLSPTLAAADHFPEAVRAPLEALLLPLLEYERDIGLVGLLHIFDGSDRFRQIRIVR